MSDNCIEVRGVYKIFGRNADAALALSRACASKKEVLEKTGCNVGLRNVSLDIPRGQISCIMGLSGSGKSTLVRHFNRLVEPTAGEILADGKDVLKLSAEDLRNLRRNSISMVFQSFGLLPHKTVLENVCFGLVARGEPLSKAEPKALPWIERVGLGGNEANYPDELSGGMRQRVGLARALAMEAPILLMDEAFSALDPLIRYDMQGLLLELQATLKKTIVFITHDLDEALRIGAQIAILRDGEMVQVGSPEHILHHPADGYVKRFVEKRAVLPSHAG